MRVNLGCGQAYMEGWTNVDESPDVKADIYMEAAQFLRQYAGEIDEIYMGHVLEHIMPGDALVTLRIMNERLRPGTVISAVTPDMDAIFQAYLDGEVSNDQVNASFIYSYVQPSPHIWCYGPESLAELFRRAGFTDVEPIDPSSWGPVFWKEGTESQWQCGVKATANGTPGPRDEELPLEAKLTHEDARKPAKAELPDIPTTEELLLRRVRHLRDELLKENERRTALEAKVRELAPPAPPVAEPPAAPKEPVTPRAKPQPAAAVPGSPAGPLTPKQKARAAFERHVPVGSPRRELAKAALLTAKEGRRVKGNLKKIWDIPGVIEAGEPSYKSWSKLHDASAHGLSIQTKISTSATHQISTLVVVLASGKADADLVKQSYDSVRAQSWTHWSLACASPSELVPGTTPDAPCWTGDGDITVAVNSLVSNSDADFVVLLDAGDQLAPDALYHVALSAHRDPLVDLVYWDDDLLDGGTRREPRFRPSWSPDLLAGADYVGHSFAIRRKRFLVNSGLRSGFGDAATWDLLLRADLAAERVARVPRVLGHVHRRYDRPDGAGVRAVQEHLDRKGLAARAVASGQGVRTEWTGELPKVTVVICTRHNRPMLSTVLPSLARTTYSGGFEVVVVDNGGESKDNNAWYGANSHGLDLKVEWWTEPFSYPAVNNLGARKGDGDVLVFLNDDTEIVDPTWLTEMVGWAVRPEIGVAGLQLTGPDGEIQHAGVVLGLGGFADHVFQGMRPGSQSHLGPTGWYRNVLSVTSACVAVRRELFEELGGFDERFLMCGSDVAIGLDAVIKGYRNVCSPYAGVRHLESATRDPGDIPAGDFFASYWRYNPWLFGGDPYYSPNLSLGSRVPKLKGVTEKTPQERISGPLGRTFKVFRQSTTEQESTNLADMCRALPVDAKAVEKLHADNAAPFEVKTVNWFFPDLDSPFYGGINTALRIADQLAREHGVENRFVVWGSGPDHFIRSGLAAAFPALKDCEIHFYDGSAGASLEKVPDCDVAIATLWVTAYGVAHFQGAKRKFYLIQDFEPMFYPASTLYALTEETYKLGLYGLCNTENLQQIYDTEYAGKGWAFTPAIDPTVFHANGRVERMPEDPATVFVYARPGHWRNCWEMASLALDELKDRLGDRVRIVTAGSWAVPEGGYSGMHHYGLLDYRATGELYRTCDIGLALTVSKHPSYLPLELMACGVPVVAFDNPWGHWVLQDEENSLLAKRTVDGLVDALERAVVDYELRVRLRKGALATIAAGHSSWGPALEGIYGYLCDPEGHVAGMTRVVVATADVLGAAMAGPAIRAWQFASALADAGHDVSLLSTAGCTRAGDGRFEVGMLTAPPAGVDVFVVQGSVLQNVPAVAASDACVVVDLYDPYHLENLELSRDRSHRDRMAVVHNATAILNRAMRRGDFFLTASEKQRDFWIGALASLGRVNALTYDADPSLRSLLDLVPFGVASEPPTRTVPALRGVVPGIGADDVVLLWGGGLYNWFDPQTLVKAVDEVRQTRADVRLVFLGGKHPNPNVPAMRTAVETRELSDALGLTGTHVFFNEGWVPYDDRGSYLLDADIGVSTHLDHVETAFSFRTRILDYLWAGLPVVATGGDVFSEVISESGIGRTVPAEDVEALAVALLSLVEDVGARRACAAASAELSKAYRWDVVLQPLLDYCAAPQRAPDLLDEVARYNLGRPFEPVRAPTPEAGWRGEVALARQYLEKGGAGLLAKRVANRALKLARGNRS